MASQPSAMPASRWRSNHFLLQPSRRWIWFFIVGAVLAGSVTSAPEARADTGYFRRSIPPFWKTSFKQALIDRVIQQSTPEEFLQYFIDQDAPPTPPKKWFSICRSQDENDRKVEDAHLFIAFLKAELISPEQVAERFEDVTKVLHVFVTMHSEKKLKTLECDYSNQKLRRLYYTPKFSSKESIYRLLALYERQPKAWLRNGDYGGFYDAFRVITIGSCCSSKSELWEKKLPMELLKKVKSRPDRGQWMNRLYIQAVLAFLPGLEYDQSLLPDVFKELFERKCWIYSDLCLPTLFHVVSRLHSPDENKNSPNIELRNQIIRRMYLIVYGPEKLELPENVSDHLSKMIRKMFWDYLPESKHRLLLGGLEKLKRVNMEDFVHFKDVVNPPPGPAEEDFDISWPLK